MRELLKKNSKLFINFSKSLLIDFKNAFTNLFFAFANFWCKEHKEGCTSPATRFFLKHSMLTPWWQECMLFRLIPCRNGFLSELNLTKETELMDKFCPTPAIKAFDAKFFKKKEIH